MYVYVSPPQASTEAPHHADQKHQLCNTSPFAEEQDENQPQGPSTICTWKCWKFVQARADAEFVSVVEQGIAQRHNINDVRHHGPTTKHGNTANAYKPAKPAMYMPRPCRRRVRPQPHCVAVLPVHSNQDAEHHGPDDSEGKTASQVLFKPTQRSTKNNLHCVRLENEAIPVQMDVGISGTSRQSRTVWTRTRVFAQHGLVNNLPRLLVAARHNDGHNLARTATATTPRFLALSGPPGTCCSTATGAASTTKTAQLKLQATAQFALCVPVFVATQEVQHSVDVGI